MSRSAEPLLLEVVLEAVRTRINAVGLRPVARDIGLDPKSVTQLLEGAAPRRSTRQKLERWFVRIQAADAEPEDVVAASAAVHFLTRELSEPQRSRAVVSLLKTLREHYEASGLPVPQWMGELDLTFTKNT